MHDKILEAIQKEVLPIDFIQCLLSVLEEDLNEIKKNRDFYSSLPDDESSEMNIRREELITSLSIRASKLIELTSEIELYLKKIREPPNTSNRCCQDGNCPDCNE